METSEIFKQVTAEFKQAMEAAQLQTRQYNRQNEPAQWETPAKSRFKAVIYFKNGRAAWYYSYDFVKNNGVTHVDEYEGLIKLLRCIKNKNGQYKTALIFASAEKDPTPAAAKYDYCIVKFDSYGNSQERPQVGFNVIGKDNRLNLHYLVQTPKMIIKK